MAREIPANFPLADNLLIPAACPWPARKPSPSAEPGLSDHPADTQHKEKVPKMLSKIIKVAIMALLVAALVHSLPDIKRYIEDRRT
jgi:hypothetical protein